MDAEPGGILYLQEFFSDSVNEITSSFIDDDKSQFIEANYISVLLTMEVERREICLECLLMNSLAH